MSGSQKPANHNEPKWGCLPLLHSPPTHTLIERTNTPRFLLSCSLSLVFFFFLNRSLTFVFITLLYSCFPFFLKKKIISFFRVWFTEFGGSDLSVDYYNSLNNLVVWCLGERPRHSLFFSFFGLSAFHPVWSLGNIRLLNFFLLHRHLLLSRPKPLIYSDRKEKKKNSRSVKVLLLLIYFLVCHTLQQ